MVTTDGVRSAQATSGGTVRRRSAGSSITLTGRGGIVIIFAAGLLAEFFGDVLHLGFLPGFGFAAACGLAAVTTRASDLLTLVVSPPLVFLVITVIGEFFGALGERSLPQSMLVGVVTTFASRAPWLFFGTVLAIVIGLPRGLPATLRALRSARPESPAESADDDPVRWDD
jgi:hypothetical protein